MNGLVLALAAPAGESGYGMPRDMSADGWRIDSLIRFGLIAIGILFALMVAWMLWSVFRHGRRHAAVYDTGDSPRNVKIVLGIAALIFFGIDGKLFYSSMKDLEGVFWNFAHAESRPPCGAPVSDDCSLRIEVNAHQWAWDFRYAGLDGAWDVPAAPSRDDVVQLGVLRVPVDTPVILQLGAVDVLHSFYLPNFRAKVDIVPGSLSRLWFRAKPGSEGEYDIGCAQHCGINHYKMKGTLIVMSKAEFAAWWETASKSAAKTWDDADPNAHWGWVWKGLP